MDIQETCDVMDAQGGDRGRIGLGHTLYPVLWVGALINDDWTGLSDEEAQEVDDFVKHADGCPVGVDWGTEGFYSYNDANAIGGTCVDVIFSKYNQ